ncbi:type I-F CRISPR-associated helicase Cas3f, partial [bacterium]|nr:type I-F CRISPR-associated helicase Cas3f [bacterium]
PISDPFIMHLARLCLMVGDHNFSSLSLEQSNNVVKGDATSGVALLANTDRETRDPKQRLDQHLLGVAKYTARFSRLLPQLSQHLPAIDKLKAKAFTQRTSIKRFQWQNRAADLATKLQQASQIQGFFGVNMASTGCGKTLANARIMYGLADPKVGARFTIALGLRILTLQTGQALREKLSLDEDSLAILVGSQASRKLFELDQAGKEDQANDLEQVGSESLESLVDETIAFGDSGFDDAILGTVIENPKARDLLFTPIISCTIDHIIGASENTRGGKHIAPMLRLLSSDLILDEPDDFSQSDMPALSRLVHLAGMYGSRILLSSATLTPDITAGLFMAYQAGRNIWSAQLGLGKVNVTCAWFDEYGQANSDCNGVIAFNFEHEKFIQKRAAKLRKEPARRIAEVMPVDLPRPPENQQVHYPALAAILVNEVQALHQRHHEAAQNSNQTASIGLIRCANIKPLVSLAKQLYSFDNELDDTQIHLCCYHARQLLVLRNGLEKKLDRLLQRSGEQSLFEHPEIADRVNSSDKQHHIFVVLATAVAEVGRDHDYDWAIVEPSSLRSIIQLAGRVRRHRPAMKTQQANIKIMSTNIKALSHGANLGVGHAVFDRPGFEEDSANGEFLLNTHSVDLLISQKQLSTVNAIPRITRQKELKPSSSLVDLEHGVLAKLLNNPQRNFVNAFWTPGNGNHAGAHLQKISPFREQTSQQTDYVCLPDTTSESGYSFVVEEHAWKTGVAGATVNSEIRYVDYRPKSYSVKPWLTEDFSAALGELGNQLGESNLDRVALRYAIVRLDDRQMGWSFHPLLGFWMGD